MTNTNAIRVNATGAAHSAGHEQPDFLQTVFGVAEGNAHIMVGLGGRYVDGRYTFRQTSSHHFAWPAEADALRTELARESACGNDVFVCPYLMHGGKRSKGAAVTRRLVHADIDGDLDAEKVRLLGGFAVSSGSVGHGHAYIALSESAGAADHQLLCRAWGAYLGDADAKISDNDLLRPVGSRNYKSAARGGEPSPVQWLVPPSGKTWAPAELAEQLDVQLGGVQSTVPARAGTPTPLSDEQVDQLPQKVLDALAEVSDDRSVDTMRVVGACVDAGLDLPTTRAAVASREDLAQRLAERTDDDIWSCWSKVTDDRSIRPSGANRGAVQRDRQPDEVLPRLIAGGAFILDQPDRIPALWGAREAILWAEGEALTLCGPPGVGKTTVAGQLVRGRIVGGDLLGLPVQPTSTRLLYLAMDRPRQIARALKRTLADIPREVLDERLVFWQGPPLSDIAKHPAELLGLARLAGADTIVVDSIKDAAVGLSDDEVGAGYNRARQLCLAEGVEVLELHHMVKRGANGSTPTSLADLYGSVWIGAGAGSVVLLWGSAGDPIVDMRHLKSPAEEVGPHKVIHDHTTGRSAVWHATDPVQLLQVAGADGLTAKQLASAMFSAEKPTVAEVEKARRKLRKLTQDGVAVEEPGDDAQQKPTRWTLTDTLTAPILSVTPHGAAEASRTAEKPRVKASREPSRPSRAETLTFPTAPVRGREAGPSSEAVDGDDPKAPDSPSEGAG